MDEFMFVNLPAVSPNLFQDIKSLLVQLPRSWRSLENQTLISVFTPWHSEIHDFFYQCLIGYYLALFTRYVLCVQKIRMFV